RRLVDRGIEADHLDRLKGVYRRSWYDNTMLLRGAVPALNALHAAGIETLLLKGSAVAAWLYDDLGLRPLLDVDVAVRAEHALDAAACLAEAGWHPSSEKERVTEAQVEKKHGSELVHANGHRLDLHWRVLEEARGREVEDDLWTASVATELMGAPARMLSPSDQLAFSCVHGVRTRGLVTHLRWVPDAVRLIAHGPIEWDRVVRWGQDLRMAPFLSAALGFLHRETEAEIPASALAALADAPFADRFLYDQWMREGSARAVPMTLLRSVARHRGEPLPAQVREWTRALMRMWDVDRPHQLPATAARKMVRRIRAT
ncbi:MAG: nucleotidyltransferase family protein, partial [Bacteroidota bacterium]